MRWEQSGSCPQCGAPIWSQFEDDGGPPVAVRRYCECGQPEPVDVLTVWTYPPEPQPWAVFWTDKLEHGTRYKATS